MPPATPLPKSSTTAASNSCLRQSKIRNLKSKIAMATTAKPSVSGPIQHPGESESNDIRRRLAAVEPASLRTFTPSLAVLARSAGCYHWTPEGRKLADFTSGVLVSNLGHNPTRWWQRVFQYMGLDRLPDDARPSSAVAGAFFSAVTLT